MINLNNDIEVFSVLFGVPLLTFPDILPGLEHLVGVFVVLSSLTPRSFPGIYQLILYVITFLHVI